jgi:disulfide oxidoreductase YuzD
LLDRLYGDKVSVEFYDMATTGAQKEKSELLAKVPENQMYYPLVFANGELKIVGSAEYYQVLYMVRELIAA